jgi:CubicO group peptidase (beta-lactamase class C family)
MKTRVFSRPLALTIVLTLILLMLAQCQNGRTPPASPAYIRLTELISAINSGSYDSLHEYASSSFSEELIAGQLDERVDSLMRIHTRSEKLTLIRALSSSKYQVIAEVYNYLAEMNTVLGVSVEHEQPNRITMWYQGPAYAYEQWEPGPGLTQSQVIEAMESMLVRLGSRDAFSGVVLIGRDDSILWQRAFGLAHRDPDVLNDIETRFNIASVGKLFTTVSIAQLAEQGLLSYDDPVANYLGSDWLAPDVASEITIEHLLTHRSGLGDFLESEELIVVAAPPTGLDVYQPIIREDRPRFTPGSQFQYSNSGFILLGVIVEQVTGQMFSDYVEMNVHLPASILGPTDPPRDIQYLPAPQFATGYISTFSSSGHSWTNNTDIFYSVFPGPAGGQFCTAEELWHFAGAIRTATLVDEQTWQLLSAPFPDGGPVSYGFEVIDYGAERIVGHGGSHQGISAVLDVYLHADYTLVVVANSDRSAFLVREKFANLVLR